MKRRSGTTIPANYNAVLAMKILTRLRAVALLVILCAAPSFAGSWDKPVADLAKAIAGAAGPGSITLAVTNASSLPKDQVPEIQKALEAQLRASGVRVGPAATANSDVQVTLSENLKSLVWVAEIKQGNQAQIEMVTVPREQSVAQSKNAPSVSLHKMLLFAQSAPILDAYVMDAASPNARLFVLDPENITVYTIAGNTWQKQQSWTITHNHPFPRDLRGLLVANQSRGVDAYLPGTVCEVSQQASLCRDGDDPWKIGAKAAFFNSARNYFTGATVPASQKAGSPFYSAAWMQRGNYSLALFMGVDGRLRVTDGINERLAPPSVTADWGSDIAVVSSGCGLGTQLLVTAALDDTQADSLRAFEIPDRDPVLVSSTLDFPGPIVSLWSHDSTTSVAIARNLRNGNYEAYSVSATCNH
ncbi:MAG TPA: hypothetical protein VFP40_03565 [Terriglobales bacterium]|nr:hypothetical protein [Terriglobales bacterium]